MMRYLAPLALVVLFPLLMRAQQQADSGPPAEEKGTYLGVLLSPVPEVLYDQLPQLPRGQGVVVTHVLPDSPASQAGLQRHDVLLQYDDDKVRDCEQLSRLIRADKPDRKVKLTLLRRGQQMTVDVTLTLGPVLRIAQGNRAAGRDNAEAARGTAKGGGPPAVTFAATPLEGGKTKLTIEYYQEGTGRLHSVTCEGTLEELEGECQKLPPKVQNLAQVALERMRKLEFQSKDRSNAPNRR